MNPRPLSLQLSLEEVNILLHALGDRPFVEVYELIQKIREQAAAQVQATPSPPMNGETTVLDHS